MDLSPPPTKPPRGVKNAKETSGLLIHVIRTLSTSESNEQREREKAKLEREYKKSDQQLNALVAEHKEDLETVMQLFSEVSGKITTTREKLKGVKEVLIACKTLLSCRRDELKKLWLEGVEHKHVLKLLEEIELLKDVPVRLNGHLNSGEYIKATKLLVTSLNIGQGALEGVEALKEVKEELIYKREKLYDQLLKQIEQIIYLEPNETRISGSFRGKSNWCKKIIEVAQKLPSEDYQSNLSDLVECLQLLNKLPDAAESIKTNMESNLLKLVDRVSKSIVINNEGNPLVDLIETLNIQFKKIAQRYKSLSRCFETLKNPYFRESDIWYKIQTVLQLVLTEYLDIQNANEQRNETFTETEDISSYFARRRIPRRKVPLFKFEYSLHSKEPEIYDVNQRDKILVYTPDPLNITIVYLPVQKFVEEIEDFIGKTPCGLSTFINDYVKEVFIGREHQRISLKIETATKSVDAWKIPSSSQETVDLGLPRPVLLSTVLVSNAIKELESLLDSLPMHKAEISEILITLLKNYTETCYAAYRGIVQPEPEDKRLCSVSWLKDEDISRFLKTLPNWIDLQAQKPRRPLKREDTADEESPEDVRQRNIKEAEILMTNLTESGVSEQEIISDIFQLKCLAQLQESMEWFSWRVLQIQEQLKKQTAAAQSFANLSHEFEELANTCLLMLHLEIRVQCFHYLLPKEIKSHNLHDPDPRVLDLTRVLVSIDEALSSSLQGRKIKYIFEGLGQLIGKILMNTNFMETVDEGSIHKMCRNIFTLQQTLSNVTTTRDLALDNARKYFQLFFQPPEDILNQVLEKGPSYTKAEYINLIQLIVKNSEDYDHVSLQRYMQKLNDILGENAINV